MFFRSVTKIGATAAKYYLKASAYGAGGGAIVGGVIGTPLAFGVFGDSLIDGHAKTLPGRFADGIKKASCVIGVGAFAGALIGGAPVTYPCSKAYDYVSSKLHAKDTQDNSSSYQP